MAVDTDPQEPTSLPPPASLQILEAVPPPATSSADNKSPRPLSQPGQPPAAAADAGSRPAACRFGPGISVDVSLNHYVADHLMLARRLGRSWFHLPPLLITGPAGAGKSRWARRLAQLSGTSSTMISAAGSSDNKQLASASRTWSTGRPCLPVTLMAQDSCPNPIIVVDEIDKVSESRHNGHFCDTLLVMAEPETSRRHFDEYLLTAADLSAVTWVLLANTAAGVPALLRSRG